jgi:hypothetical protein
MNAGRGKRSVATAEAQARVLRPVATHAFIRERRHREEATMLWTIFVILLVLWLLGMVTSYTLGGFIHLLLVIAVVVVLIRIIQGRKPL